MVELASIADTRGKRVLEGTRGRGRGRGELCREIFAILYALLLGFAKMYMSSVKKYIYEPIYSLYDLDGTCRGCMWTHIF
jgi:hypothetical protein